MGSLLNLRPARSKSVSKKRLLDSCELFQHCKATPHGHIPCAGTRCAGYVCYAITGGVNTCASCHCHECAESHGCLFRPLCHSYLSQHLHSPAGFRPWHSARISVLLSLMPLCSWQPVTPSSAFIAEEKRGVSVSKETRLVCVIPRNGFISIELKPAWEGCVCVCVATQLRVVHIYVHMHECGSKVNLGVVPREPSSLSFQTGFLMGPQACWLGWSSWIPSLRDPPRGSGCSLF